jgi:hypothetical protein
MDTTRSWRLYWKGDDQFAHTGQALNAYAGGTGGYSEGHWGGGIYGPSWKNTQIYAEMLVGAGGGGGIDSGSALLFKPSVGLEFQLTPKLSLQTGLGKFISKSDNLDSSFLEANLVYRFGTAYR